MRLSSKSQYGLKACFILAKHYNSRCISASMLEKEIAVSNKYIEKIMRMLSYAGVIQAVRGAAGGYKLARSPQDITIGDVVRALEDNMEIADCITASCRCAAGDVWRMLYQGINAVLDSMSLQSLLDNGCELTTNGACNVSAENKYLMTGVSR